MKRWQAIGTLLLTMIGWAAPLHGQGPPINTQTAFVVGLEGAAVRSFLKFTRKSQLLVEDRETADPLDRDFRVMAVPVMLPYEVVPNRLVLIGALPFLDKELSLTQNGVRRKLSSTGVGDAALLARFQVFQWDAFQRTTRISLFGGVKFPTGEDDETDTEGNRLPPGLQLGTGSVDFKGGAVFTHAVGAFGINADGIVELNTRANGLRRGNALSYDLALGLRVLPFVYETYPSPQINLYLEVNGLLQGHNDLEGKEVVDSGGNLVLLSPGIQFIPFRTFLIEGSVQLPVVEDVNGTQLGTDLAANIGFRWLLWD